MYLLNEVSTSKQAKVFVEMPTVLYKKCENWVRPLDKDIYNVFDESKNPCFKDGKCKRWLLMDGDKCIGRVAAFINGMTYNLDDYKVGQMGFFECINEEKAAFMLFDKCVEWLKSEKMDCVEGPVNFGERIEWWGLLTYGFDKTPVYGMPYTHEYYIKFFDDYGFKDYFKQFTYRAKLEVESLSKVVIWKSDRLFRDKKYKVLTYGQIGRAKAIDSLLEVYNKTWNMEVHGVKEITRAEVEAIYKNLQPIIDKDLIYFAYYNDKPIGFFLMFPEMNQILKHLNGKMDLLGMIKFLYYKNIKKIDVALGQLFGVIPEFQNKGVEAAMITYFCREKVQQNSYYKYLELNWVGDFNPPMMHLMDYIGAHVARVHTTYRLLFRNDIKFVRSADKNNKE